MTLVIWQQGYELGIEEFADELAARKRYDEVRSYRDFGRVTIAKVLDGVTEAQEKARTAVDQ